MEILKSETNNIGVFYNRLVYQGIMNHSLVFTIGRFAEKISPNTLIKKRIFSVAIEICQNIARYSEVHNLCNATNSSFGSGIFAMYEEEESYWIQSGNYILSEKLESLKKRLDFINSLNQEEISKEYRKELRRPKEKGKIGANLGFLEIRKRTNNKIKLKMLPAKEKEYSFIILSSRMLKTLKINDFFIKADKATPKIHFSAKENTLNIEGECYQEHVKEFFYPVFKWLKRYLLEPNKNIAINFKLYYFNTSSSRRFFEILIILENYQKSSKGNVVVNWHYEEDDIDILEIGEEYNEEIDLAFNFISYKN